MWTVALFGQKVRSADTATGLAVVPMSSWRAAASMGRWKHALMDSCVNSCPAPRGRVWQGLGF